MVMVTRCGVHAHLPGLQVAMETQQDAVGVAVKVQQRGDQSRQTAEPIDLQEDTCDRWDTIDQYSLIDPSYRLLKMDVRVQTHVVLQQDEHAPLGQLFGRHELVPGLPDLLRRDFASPSPLVVKVQPTAVQLLQLELRSQSEHRTETSA